MREWCVLKSKALQLKKQNSHFLLTWPAKCKHSLNAMYQGNRQESSADMLWWGRMQRPKASIKHCRFGMQRGARAEEQHPEVQGQLWCPAVAGTAPPWPCTQLRWPYRHFLSPCRVWAVQLSSTSPLTSAGDPRRVQKFGLNFQSLCVPPAPHCKAFAAEGWEHCLSKPEQTLQEKTAATAAGIYFKSAVL